MKTAALFLAVVAFILLIFAFPPGAHAYGTVKCTPNHTCGEHIRPWNKPNNNIHFRLFTTEHHTL